MKIHVEITNGVRIVRILPKKDSGKYLRIFCNMYKSQCSLFDLEYGEEKFLSIQHKHVKVEKNHQ